MEPLGYLSTLLLRFLWHVNNVQHSPLKKIYAICFTFSDVFPFNQEKL